MQSICVFGDSLSKGVIFDKIRQRYGFLKDCFVNLVSNALPLQVKNFSKFGCTIEKGAHIFQTNQAAVSQADYVVLEFGGNDSDFVWAEVAKAPEAVHQPKTPLDRFVQIYEGLILQVQNLGRIPVVMNLPPLEPKRYFNWVSQGLNGKNILQWLGGSEGFIYRWHEMYNMQICKLANRMQVPLIDIRSAFLEHSQYGTFLCADGIHPNEAGHRLIASAIEEAIPALI